jgi:hypothetical protein
MHAYVQVIHERLLLAEVEEALESQLFLLRQRVLVRTVCDAQVYGREEHLQLYFEVRLDGVEQVVPGTATPTTTTRNDGDDGNDDDDDRHAAGTQQARSRHAAGMQQARTQADRHAVGTQAARTYTTRSVSDRMVRSAVCEFCSRNLQRSACMSSTSGCTMASASPPISSTMLMRLSPSTRVSSCCSVGLVSEIRKDSTLHSTGTPYLCSSPSSSAAAAAITNDSVPAYA